MGALDRTRSRVSSLVYIENNDVLIIHKILPEWKVKLLISRKKSSRVSLVVELLMTSFLGIFPALLRMCKLTGPHVVTSFHHVISIPRFLPDPVFFV